MGSLVCVKTVSKFAYALALLGILTGGVEAQTASGDDSTAFMTTTGRTSQPIGHYDFCQRYAAECLVRTKAPSRVRLTPELWNQLVEVNALVNLAIKPATDQEVYGVPEYWAYPTTRGDCEDLVLLKRRDLIEEGWPVGALLITVVRQRNGDGHAVLTVTTDRGDLVLDSLQPRVRLWTDTDYQYVKRQSEFNSGQWVAIDDARDISVGSVTR
jgi:predicted transglutaminase-like cysteine proteinase